MVAGEVQGAQGRAGEAHSVHNTAMIAGTLVAGSCVSAPQACKLRVAASHRPGGFPDSPGPVESGTRGKEGQQHDEPASHPALSEVTGNTGHAGPGRGGTRRAGGRTKAHWQQGRDKADEEGQPDERWAEEVNASRC